MRRRPVVVTGVGLVSSLGEDLGGHVRALTDGHAPRIDAERFAPYLVHPAAPIAWDLQIPKRSDQRQMEPWQRLGCYAAGLALDSAGIEDDAALKARMQLVVASGGGERDWVVDGRILTGLRDAPDPGAYLNERLMSDLRPTLFLAQLSNLLAGNIAIVHGVTGASRTFMGEEACGTDALRIAEARVAAGQADIMMVGGSFNAERPDSLLLFEMGGYLWSRAYVPVLERPPAGGGFVLGSAAAFLVIEGEAHATARGAKALARLHPVGSARTRREPGDVGRSLERLWRDAAPSPDATIISAATGVAGPTEEETDASTRLAPAGRRYVLGDLVGHTLEASAPVAAAIGAGLIGAGHTSDVVAPIVGHRRGEGLVRLSALR